MRSILVLAAIVTIGLCIAPFLQFVWSNPKISDMSAITMTSLCLLVALLPTLAFEPVRRFFKTPSR